MQQLSPEEIELDKKRRTLTRLEDRLAEREEFMVGLRAELNIFEARYTMEVARYYAELDELEADIAAEEARLAPDDWEIQQRAAEAKQRAAESAEAVGEENWQACSHKFNPSAAMKKSYYNLAKLIHPDLATDAQERERRHELMAKLNDAYAVGDAKLMDILVEEYRDNPDLIIGASLGDQLIKLIRQIYAVKRRLVVLNKERAELLESEKYQLSIKVESEMRNGRSLLSQMAERTKTHIKRARRKLDILRRNTVVLDANEHYGMNVEMFR